MAETSLPEMLAGLARNRGEAGERPADEKKEASGGDEEMVLDDACEDFIAGIEKKDPRLMKDALKAFFMGMNARR